MEYIAYILISIGIIELVWGLATSYNTRGGSIGQVPVLAIPFQAAIIFTLGLVLLGRSHSWTEWRWWYYLRLFLGISIGGGWAVALVGRIAERRSAT